jgi:hypothetical protein
LHAAAKVSDKNTVLILQIIYPISLQLKSIGSGPFCFDNLDLLGVRELACAFKTEGGSLEDVSKPAWIGLSALDSSFRLLPGALPQADIERAFGPLILWSRINLSAEGAIPYQPGATPQE